MKPITSKGIESLPHLHINQTKSLSKTKTNQERDRGIELHVNMMCVGTQKFPFTSASSIIKLNMERFYAPTKI